MEVSKAEFEILNAIWANYPCTAKAVIERLNQQGSWHEKTVKTLLGRLVKKEAIKFEKCSRHYLYSPLIVKDEYIIKESDNFLKRLFGGKVSPLVASFAKSEKLSQNDVDELKKIISDWENNND
ncbi:MULTISPECIES: BlaI/MecI/CopY family transcriptional regulator [Pseudoalteromonas]|nr:BlaI/MecI/CopY family transcriptional regulator [Pseudoalteromonas piscicida]KJY91935.1 CopY family transcriptional repressor [Pseudoalteromonas piscicida]